MNIDIKISGKNLLNWSHFEDWVSGASAAPTNHVLSGASAAVAREATIIKSGTYSMKITRSGTNCKIAYELPAFADYRNRKVTLGCWVYATVADRGRISLDDGVSAATNSSYHTGGSSWERLSVTHDINPCASKLSVEFQVNTGNTAVYFDAAILNEGDQDIVVLSDICTISKWNPVNRYRAQKSTVARREGVVSPNVRFESKAISIEGMVAESTATLSRDNLDALLKIANSYRIQPDRDSEIRDLYLFDDRLIQGYLESSDLNNKASMRIRDFRLKYFCPNPLFRSPQMYRTSQAISGDTTFTVTNNGNAKTPVIITITNSSSNITSLTLDNKTSDELFSFSGSLVTGTDLVVDTDKLTVTNDGVSELESFTGDFAMMLLPGANAFSITGVVAGTILVDYFNRWF